MTDLGIRCFRISGMKKKEEKEEGLKEKKAEICRSVLKFVSGRSDPSSIIIRSLSSFMSHAPRPKSSCN